MAGLDLFLNASEQEDYENCVDHEVVSHPNNWITEFTTSHASFQNWDASDMVNVSADAAKAVTDKCADQETCSRTGTCPKCQGCSIAISYIYKKYESYLNNMYAEMFKSASGQMYDKLHQANMILDTQ